MSGEETRDATINAVAAALRLHACIRLRVGVWECSCGESLPYADQYTVTLGEHQALALAEAGWLKDPADRVLTPTDQAVLDAAEAMADAWWSYDDRLSGGEYRLTHEQYINQSNKARAVLIDAVRARRAAVGGSAPTDPKEAKP